jgi:predicted acetyltransferase
VKNSVPYYPLPSNEGYEKFLQVMKKDQCIIVYFYILDNKTQYSLTFLLSLRKKYEERPSNMAEIKIPLKHEIRSRAKILTDEAFRETRNYLDVHTEVKNPQSRDFLNNLYKKIAIRSKEKNKDENLDEIYLKTSQLRELLNKISLENFDSYSDQILKYNYDEVLLENFKVGDINIIYTNNRT